MKTVEEIEAIRTTMEYFQSLRSDSEKIVYMYDNGSLVVWTAAEGAIMPKPSQNGR